MDRLTGRDENTGTAYYLHCFDEPCFGMGCDNPKCEHDYAAAARLAAYEDTELTPEEIESNMEMFEAYHYVCGGKSPEEKQALISQAEKRWIPISERYPTEKDANSNGLIIAYSAYLMKTTVCTWHHIIDDGVTSHWMPMPELPKED